MDSIGLRSRELLAYCLLSVSSVCLNVCLSVCSFVIGVELACVPGIFEQNHVVGIEAYRSDVPVFVEKVLYQK